VLPANPLDSSFGRADRAEIFRTFGSKWHAIDWALERPSNCVRFRKCSFGSSVAWDQLTRHGGIVDLGTSFAVGIRAYSLLFQASGHVQRLFAA
jgi:hypothetical protein